MSGIITRLIKGRDGQGLDLLFRGSLISCDEVLSSVEEFETAHPYLALRRVGVAVTSPLVLFKLLVALSDLVAHVILLRMSFQCQDAALRWKLSFLVLAGNDSDIQVQQYACVDDSGGASEGSLTVFTSVTTGDPRPHRWSSASLLERLRVPEQVCGGVWVSACTMTSFAGIQAMLYACSGADTLVLLETTDALVKGLPGDRQLRLAMATPTFWRRSLILEAANDLRDIGIQTISMGGEPITQDLIDELGRTFECKRLVHIYASSAYGSIFSVSDGKAGFPVAWLDYRLRSGLAVTVRENELYVSLRAPNEWLPTGDLVRFEGDRVHFDGRRSEQINVGGQKVSPMRIEAALRSIGGVADARVHGIVNAITGQAVAAELIIQDGEERSVVERPIRTHFREHHPPYERPLRLKFVEAFDVTQAGKIARR